MGIEVKPVTSRPIHVHVKKASATAKVQIENGVLILESHGFSPKALKIIKKFCEENTETITQAWENFFDV